MLNDIQQSMLAALQLVFATCTDQLTAWRAKIAAGAENADKPVQALTRQIIAAAREVNRAEATRQRAEEFQYRRAREAEKLRMQALAAESAHMRERAEAAISDYVDRAAQALETGTPDWPPPPTSGVASMLHAAGAEPGTPQALKLLTELLADRGLNAPAMQLR